MARAALHQSCLPERSYGECLIAMCTTLEAMPHKRGGKLTRLEKWEGKLLPRQRERIWHARTLFVSMRTSLMSS